MSKGDTLETGTVGFAGASWISASIGAPSMPCETIVAIGGDAHALDIKDLDQEMKWGPRGHAVGARSLGPTRSRGWGQVMKNDFRGLQ